MAFVMGLFEMRNNSIIMVNKMKKMRSSTCRSILSSVWIHGHLAVVTMVWKRLVLWSWWLTNDRLVSLIKIAITGIVFDDDFGSN